MGDAGEIADSAEESGFNIRGAEVIDPKNFDRIDEMAEMFCELRKGKGVTMEQARETLSHANYFGTMLVKMGNRGRAFRRRYIFHRGYGASGASADQDKTRQ